MIPYLPTNLTPQTDSFVDFRLPAGDRFSARESDINVLKDRKRFEAKKQAMRFLQDLVDLLEITEHNGSMGMATEGLLWLKRFLLDFSVH